ncbi:unnamed protein product [Rotaria magnacalcarata]|uniref:Aminotransferase class I/classII large domain-containing protein n=2 Tax=Rotaria magnacalcarata TaxID=392030 RepID=A0A816RTG6_9BILA|nr:unnamed protein product [Rotaria magnacalcarata]
MKSLIATPYYSSFDFDASTLASNEIFHCPLLKQDTGEFEFSVDIFRHGYGQAIIDYRQPRAIMINNPQNPRGDIYDDEKIRPILEFAFINSTETFQSILNYKTLPDPMRTPFLWSFSKDFGLSGVHFGVLYDGSKELSTIGAELSFLFGPSSVIQQTLASLLGDHQWIHSYINMSGTRLLEQYQLVKDRLEKLDQRTIIRTPEGWVWVWVSFRRSY